MKKIFIACLMLTSFITIYASAPTDGSTTNSDFFKREIERALQYVTGATEPNDAPSIDKAACIQHPANLSRPLVAMVIEHNLNASPNAQVMYRVRNEPISGTPHLFLMLAQR